MGLFDFIGDVAEVAVRVAITPVKIVQDGVEIFAGDCEPRATTDNFSKIAKKVEDAAKDIGK